MTKKSSIKSSGPDAKDNDAVEYKRACSKESEEKKPEEDSSGISLQENRPSSPGACSNTELILLPPGDDRTDHYDHDPHDHLQKHDHHSVGFLVTRLGKLLCVLCWCHVFKPACDESRGVGSI